MARMGYVVGQGLGKNSEGRAQPVPIQLLPQGLTSTAVYVLLSEIYFIISRELGI